MFEKQEVLRLISSLETLINVCLAAGDTASAAKLQAQLDKIKQPA